MIISHFQCYTFIGFYYMIHVLQEFNLNACHGKENSHRPLLPLGIILPL
jgi:hypothetical protein